MKKKTIDLKEKYNLNTYKPNKNAKGIKYKGTIYASKVQCQILNDITRKELDAYIAENPDCMNV